MSILCLLGRILRFIMKGFSVAAILVLIITVLVSIISVDSGPAPARFTGKDSPSTQTDSLEKARNAASTQPPKKYRPSPQNGSKNTNAWKVGTNILKKFRPGKSKAE